ncbi:hypothetical protein CDD83_4738 [Cordyceps sp. RAO-2017]|nr:hypothetical protein CDD83_4738 [Cordyceps sp. RAO-2017]
MISSLVSLCPPPSLGIRPRERDGRFQCPRETRAPSTASRVEPPGPCSRPIYRHQSSLGAPVRSRRRCTRASAAPPPRSSTEPGQYDVVVARLLGEEAASPDDSHGLLDGVVDQPVQVREEGPQRQDGLRCPWQNCTTVRPPPPSCPSVASSPRPSAAAGARPAGPRGKLSTSCVTTPKSPRAARQEPPALHRQDAVGERAHRPVEPAGLLPHPLACRPQRVQRASPLRRAPVPAAGEGEPRRSARLPRPPPVARCRLKACRSHPTPRAVGPRLSCGATPVRTPCGTMHLQEEAGDAGRAREQAAQHTLVVPRPRREQLDGLLQAVPDGVRRHHLEPGRRAHDGQESLRRRHHRRLDDPSSATPSRRSGLRGKLASRQEIDTCPVAGDGDQRVESGSAPSASGQPSIRRVGRPDSGEAAVCPAE